MSSDKQKPKATPFVAAMVGGVAGAIQITLTYPTEYVKTVMQLEEGKQFRNSFELYRQTYQKHGLMRFFKGYDCLLMFTVPKNFVRFSIYQYMLTNHLNRGTKMDNFCAGLLSGVGEALFVVVPQETIKVKLIHDRLQEKPRFRNLAHGVKSVISEKGFSGIYKGMSTTVLR